MASVGITSINGGVNTITDLDLQKGVVVSGTSDLFGLPIHIAFSEQSPFLDGLLGAITTTGDPTTGNWLVTVPASYFTNAPQALVSGHYIIQAFTDNSPVLATGGANVNVPFLDAGRLFNSVSDDL